MDWQNMSEREFFGRAKDFLHKLHRENEQLNEEARIALFFMREFKPKLLQFLKESDGFSEVVFKKESIIEEECNYDMRKCMDNEIISAVAEMGIRYDWENSTDKELCFKRDIL